MIYEYECESCKLEFEVIKSMHDSSREENCPECKTTGRRIYSSKVYFNGTKVSNAEFNPGLGCVVKNERHKKYVMESKGLVEVGNDYGNGEKMQKKFEQDKVEKQKKEWDAL